MSRYIDADAYAAEMKARQDACKEIMDAAKEDENWELYDRMGAMFSIFVEAKLTLDAMPTVDAVTVVHGEWSNRRTWTHDGEWYCTACDKEITIYMGEKRGNDRYKYCPNCGAKMDGKDKDDGTTAD